MCHEDSAFEIGLCEHIGKSGCMVEMETIQRVRLAKDRSIRWQNYQGIHVICQGDAQTEINRKEEGSWLNNIVLISA